MENIPELIRKMIQHKQPSGYKLLWSSVSRECHKYLCTQSLLTLGDPTACSQPASSVLRSFPGKNIGVGCHFLLQGIFLIQGLNLRL